MKRTSISADSPFAFAPSSDHPPSGNRRLSLSFQDLLDAVPVGVFIVDARGYITACNDMFLDMAGAPRSKVIGFDLINSSRDPSLISHLKKALSGDHAEFETPYTSTTGGKASYYHYVFQPLASPRDDAAVMCFAQDLYKLKVMETAHESLRLSEQKFSQAFRNNPDPMIISAIDTGRIHETNWGFTQLLGYSAAEIIGRTTMEIGLWADATRRDEVVAVMNQKGALSNHEADLLTKDGRTVTVLGSASHLMIEGQPYWLVQFRDITERKRIEAALRESEERWKFAIDGAGDGLWDWNIQTGVAFYSPRYKQMLGYDDADFGTTSEEWTKRIHPDDLPGVFAALQPYMDGKPGSAAVEFRMVCKDGSWKWMLGRGMVVSRDADGKPLRMIGTNTNIDARKQAETELVQYRDHLEELVSRRTSELEQSRDAAEAGNRAKTIFLANMSHELRTPMAGVMGMLELALRRATDPKLIDMLNKSKGAAQRMVNVVGDIIDFSKAEAERLPMEEKNFSLSQLIDDAITLQTISSEAKGLSLTREIPATFPDQLSGDAFHLRQILLNLLGNACKFSEQGTITVRVSAVEQDGDSVLARIEVEDQGIGVSLEQQAILFQAFTQADGSMTRKYSGSGLGLIISKRLANLMGGDVGVASQEGRGSTFWVTVRLKPAKASGVGI